MQPARRYDILHPISKLHFLENKEFILFICDQLKGTWPDSCKMKICKSISLIIYIISQFN